MDNELNPLIVPPAEQLTRAQVEALRTIAAIFNRLADHPDFNAFRHTRNGIDAILCDFEHAATTAGFYRDGEPREVVEWQARWVKASEIPAKPDTQRPFRKFAE